MIGNKPIATTMVGAYPRPNWYTVRFHGGNLAEHFRYISTRESFIDANVVAIEDQTRAGLDIIADPRFWYDELYVAWLSAVAGKIDGIVWKPSPVGRKPGDSVWNEIGAAEGTYVVKSHISGSELEFSRIYTILSRLTGKKLKFGSIAPTALAALVENEFYSDRKELIMDLAKIYNRELRLLVDAGCRIIQLEEPFWRTAGPTHGFTHSKDEWTFLIEAFNKTVEGLSNRASIWMHFCWAGAGGQTVVFPIPKWDSMFPYILEANADVINLEQASSGGQDLHLFEEYPTDREVAIGAVDHRILRVETPEEVAAIAERSVKYIEPNRLFLTTDCGLGRQSLPRFQAFQKLKSLAAGAELIRKKIKQ